MPGPHAVAAIPQPAPAPEPAAKIVPDIAPKTTEATYAAVPLPKPKPPTMKLASVPAHAESGVPLPPRRQALAHQQRPEQRTAAHTRKPQVIREVWTDAHGRPLSAREVREIKRLLHESDSRSAGRSRGDASFDKVWR